MSYIGREPQIGNFQMCDAISVVNNQAAYTMQVGGVAVIPNGNFNVICSLNGVIQKAGTSFTISSSTISFSQNLVTGDVIDFILILGSVLDLGVPSDGTVTTGKIADNAVTSAKLASGLALGKIGQVVTATTSTEVSNTSGTYADVGLSASITPTATSSKIYIMVSASMAGFTGNSGATNVFSFVRLVRGSTEIAEYLGVRGKIPSGGTNFTVGGSNSFTDLDSPSTTSAVTYKAQQKLNDVGDGRTSHFSFNNKLSTITLMEVLA